ncbi:hypothetical protein [Xanthomonas citri]|uniref:hypothetical protein n=1 Tax=Xanthomonas citri TaxID=346 RepID=UPI001FC919D9|nr:hypothetical protein [Xanthomonas citri]
MARNPKLQTRLSGTMPPSALSGIVVQTFLSTPASRLVEKFLTVTPFDPFDKELGYSYVFPALELALWRPDMEEPQGKYFSTVGIGCVGYFSRRVPAKITGAT